MKSIIFSILIFLNTPSTWSNEPCPHRNFSDILSNALGTNSNLGDLQRIISRQAEVEELCDFKFVEDPKLKDINPIKLVVQMGYIDSSIDPKDPLSYDRKISAAIKDFMITPACKFEIKGANAITRKMKNGKNLEITFRDNSKEDGTFSKEISLENFKFLQNGSLEGSHYLVTIGHSRNGKGVDFYPLQSHKASRAIPVYSSAFINRLPKGLAGMAVLACDSNNYQSISGAQHSAHKKDLKLIGLDQKIFNFTDSVEDFINSVHKF